MKRKAYTDRINKGFFVDMKVSYYGASGVSKLEITNASGIVIELEKYTSIEQAQLAMLAKAAEYRNKGMEVIINPFTN